MSGDTPDTTVATSLCLTDGTLIAVKKLTKKGDKKEERTADFLSELGIVAHVSTEILLSFLGSELNAVFI